MTRVEVVAGVMALRQPAGEPLVAAALVAERLPLRRVRPCLLIAGSRRR